MSPYIVFNNFGAGAESCVGTLLWIRKPETRPRDPYTGKPVTLDQIVTLTALTGLEYESTKAQVEKYIFPEMCEHNMRMIQVGRGGQSFDDGVVIVEDTRQPSTLWFTPDDAEEQGLWTLGDEFDASGAMPKLGRPHSCAMKYKGHVLDAVILLYEYLARVYGPRDVPQMETEMFALVQEEFRHLKKRVAQSNQLYRAGLF